MTHQLHIGHNAEVLKQYPDSHFDSIITDPPYGIEFLGKDWDSHTGTLETWQQCLRVLKPGGHLLAFSAARTYHHLATNIESVGFEIRDQLMWIYSSGFPKAQDIGKSIQRRLGVKEIEGYADTTKNAGFGQTDHARVRAGVEWSTTETQVAKVRCTDPQAKQWAGWKTALKPGHEPIVMARKPMKGSTIDNVLQHGVGALNIDATRIAFENEADLTEFQSGFQHANLQKTGAPTFQGSDVAAAFRKERIRTSTRSHNLHNQKTSVFGSFADKTGDEYINTPQSDTTELEQLQGRYPSNVMGDIPHYQKYFYCPKVSRRERHAGFEQDHIPKRLTPMPGANGLKDIYDCYDKENQTDAHAQSKKFNPLTDSAPKGSRRCSTDSHERWHQGMEHKKGDKADPLAHIPTNPSGMYDVDGTGVMYNPNKKDSLAHLPTQSSMLAAVGGYFIDEAGNRTDQQSKNIWTPETGMVYAHGLSKIYAAWCQNNNKTSAVGNNHPTVKPVALMRYLIQLVTPAGSRVLDPFMGSGSTGMAAVELGHRFVGIDLDANYVSIANRRILGWCAKNPIESKTKTESPMVAVTKPDSAFDRLFE